ncbi:spondin domain-containing protein [bacterium]|nr:spondin domain-containing protein [bacterium]
MSQRTHSKKAILAAAILAPAASNAAALHITVEAPSNVGLAPALLSFHDGSNDFFDTGSTASAGLEALAEVGDTSTLQSSLTTGDNLTILGPGPCPFTPGSSNSAVFNNADTNTSFSFAAMVLPSNDWFIGNNNALDISSLISGGIGTSLTFEFGRVYDAGTELEDFLFSPGNTIIGIDTMATPGGGTSTNDPISLVSGADPFGSFANISPDTFDSTAFDFNSAGVGNTVIGRVTITHIPEPGVTLLGSLGILTLLIRRKRS